jgi:hypothetical protein
VLGIYPYVDLKRWISGWSSWRSSGRRMGSRFSGGGDHPLPRVGPSCPSILGFPPGNWTASELIISTCGPRILSAPWVRPGHGGVSSSGASAEPPGGSLCPGDLQRSGCGRGAGDPLWVGIDFPGAYAVRDRLGGALFTLFLVYFIARVEAGAPNTMLLAGVIVSSFSRRSSCF